MTHTPFPRLVEERAQQDYEKYHNNDTKPWDAASVYAKEEYRKGAIIGLALDWAEKHPAAIAALVEGTACVMPVKHIDTLILKIQQWQSAQGYVADPSDWLEETYNYMLAAGRLDKEGA